jgi:hypothetical protein
MWGLGNESMYGSNIDLGFKYIRAEDPERLTDFSWGSYIPVDRELPYDVYSFHYPPFVCLSRLSSATNRFSFEFSVSSSLRRLA